MARGYPDFFGLPIFPSYGPFTYESAININCPNLVTTTILTINKKAKLYGGRLYIVGAAGSGVNYYPLLYFDDVGVGSNNVGSWLEYTTWISDHFGLWVEYYNDVTQNYVIGFPRDVTFGLKLEIKLAQNSGVAATANAFVYLADVL